MRTTPHKIRSPLSLLLVLGFILLIGAFTRIETIGKRPIWYDELYTAQVVKQSKSIAEIWGAASLDGSEHPPLFYTIEYLFTDFESVSSMRVPSAIFGILSLIALFAINLTLFDEIAALAAAFLAAISVYHIEYSQDARSYMLFFLLASIIHLGAVRYINTGRTRHLAVIGIAGLSGLYTHHLILLNALPIGFTFAGAAFCSRRGWSIKQRFALFIIAPVFTLGLIAICYWPQLHNLYLYTTGASSEPLHTLNFGPRFIYELAGRWGSTTQWSWLYLTVLVVGISSMWMRSTLEALYLTLALIIPPLFFSLFPFAKFFDIRFIIGAYPAFFLFLGIGVSSISKLMTTAISRSFPIRLETARRISGNCLALLFLYASINSLLHFRSSTERCGNFFYVETLLTTNDGFCRRQLVLNSLDPWADFLLQEANRSSQLNPAAAASEHPGGE